MYDQNQSSGGSMPARDTGTSSMSGGIAGSASSWGSSAGQPSGSSAMGSTGQQRDTMGHGQGQGQGGQARDKANEMAGQASAAVDEGIDRAATGLHGAADMIRERSQQMGGDSGVQSSATMVADKLDAASTYLRDKDSTQMMSDLEALVRRKPTESLLVAAGVGFLISKILR